MDTPEKNNFLDTIRELRKEADQKLTGNRHYLAIQKLDEIAEAVQERDMSSEELGAVSEVLRGDGGDVPATVADDAGVTDESIDLVAPAVGVAGVAGAALAVDTVTLDEPVGQAVDPQSITPDEEQVLPNWWKDKEDGEAGGELEAAQPDIEPEIETVFESAPESALDLTSMAAGVAVSGIATAVVADQLSSQTVETGQIAEEIELIDVPEVEIETGDAALPAINIEAIEQEIDLPDVAEVEMPEVALEATPEIDLLDIETIAAPEIEPAVENAEVPEFVEVAPELEVEELPETVIEETVMPEIEIAAVSDIAVPDESAQIADLLSDVDVDTQAVVAAGAAAAAIGAAGIVMADEPTAAQEVELVEQPVGEIVEAPEKLSFPSVPETSEQVEIQPELATGVPAAAILNGDSISRHPTYGGNRGGILKRFVNSLRGKDYI